MQDGSFLYSQNHALSDPPARENHIYRTGMGLCMFAGYLSSLYDCRFFQFLNRFMWTFSVCYIGGKTIQPHRMSSYSQSVYFAQNEAYNCQRRIENYTYVYHRLKNLNQVHLACDDLSRLNGVPLSVPVYIENRRKFDRYLCRKRIYTQILWDKPDFYLNAIAADVQATYIYDHVLSLPCDQRYGIAEMEYMCDVIESWENETEKPIRKSFY